MAVQMLAMAFVVVGIARYLSVADFGQYSFIVALITGIMTITHFGLQQIMIREIAVDRENAGTHLGNALLTRSVMLVVGAICILIILKVMDFRGVVLLAALVAMLSEFLVGISALSKAFFQAIERMELETIVAAVFYATLLIFIYTVFWLKLGFLWIFIAIFAANLVQLIVNVLLLRGFVRISFNPSGIFQFFFADSFLLGIGILMRLNIPRVGTLMLKFIKGETAVAYFQASQSILTLVETLPVAITIAFLPFLARLSRSDEGAFVGVYEKMFKIFIAISLGISLCLFFYPRVVLTLIYGEKYIASIPALRIMSVMAVFLFINLLISSMFVVLGKQRHILVSAFLAILVSLTGSFLTIGKYGFRGAAMATTAAYMTYFLAATYFLVNLNLGFTVMSIWKKSIQKPAAAAMVTAALLGTHQYLFRSESVLVLLAGGAIYLCLLILFKAVVAEELFLIRDVLFRRNKPAVS